MSTTTAAPPLATNEAPVAAIGRAQSFADIARAAADNPALRDALMQVLTAPSVKSVFTTRTFWASVLTPGITFAIAYLGLNLDGATVGAITTLATTVAMIAMRLVTTGPATVTGAAP